MKEIQLTQGQVATVDDKDFDWLSQWKWYAQWNSCINNYYATRPIQVRGKTRSMSMARQILGLKQEDPRQAHHRNHDTLDNRRGNVEPRERCDNAQDRKGLLGYLRGTPSISTYPNYAIDRTEAHQAYLKSKARKLVTKYLELADKYLKKSK